ncbi:PAS domain-containing sensor histidine kinase [Spirosoma areae]
MNIFSQLYSDQSADRPPLADMAMLALEFSPDSVSPVRVKQANAAAQALIGPLSFPLAGAALDQLPPPFNGPELREQVNKHCGRPGSSSFQLRHLNQPDGAVQVYTGQLLNVDHQLLILTLQPMGPDARMETLGQVMERMPTGLILFQAIRDTHQTIIDFQAVLCNQMGAALSRQSRQDILTRPISERYPNMEAFELFHRYVAVVMTGQPHHQLLYLPTQDIWLDVSVVKYEDGLLVCFQDVTQGQKTASLLESVMSSSPASVRYYEAIRDESGRIIDFMTSTGNELAAYRPYRALQSTTGQRLLVLYPYLKDNGLFDRYVAVVESGQSDQFETSYPLPTHLVWFDCRAVPHGNGLVLTTLDITTRKEALVAQQQQATLLQSVLDHSLTGMAWLQSVFDAQGQLVDFILAKINATLAQVLQQSPQDLEGKLLSDQMPHQMVAGLFDRYVQVARSGQSQRFEWANPAGTIWFDVSAVAIEGGLIVTFMDITAIKLAQLTQQRQADLLQGVLNSSTSSILVLEPLSDEAGLIEDFRISLANPASLRLFSYFVETHATPHELQNHSLLSIFPTVKQRALFPALLTVVNTGQPIHTPVDYPALGLTYAYDLSPFRNGVLMITTDITPLRVYQQQLEANNLALSRSNDYLQQFAYVASHDLQEPLRKIEAFGDLLLTQHAEGLDARGQDLLRRQQQAAQRMRTLVKDLLGYARLTTQLPPFEAVSLQTLIQDVLGDLETTIRETNAHVTVNELPIIPGNATQLRQLLQNLVGNALKFAKPGQPPQVRVDAFRLRADQLPQPSLLPYQDEWVELRVADEGIGFEESYRERIFELFHRLHGRSQYVGTGIGLAVVKKVVENHQGFITVHSQTGAGATFRVYLPMA